MRPQKHSLTWISAIRRYTATVTAASKHGEGEAAPRGQVQLQQTHAPRLGVGRNGRQHDGRGHGHEHGHSNSSSASGRHAPQHPQQHSQHGDSHPAPLASTWDSAVASVELPPGPHHPPLVVPPPGVDPIAAIAPVEPVAHQPWAWKVRLRGRGRVGLEAAFERSAPRWVEALQTAS